MINEWTRKHDDKCQYKYDIEASKKPFKYITNEIAPSPQTYFDQAGVHVRGYHADISNIEKSNDLRPKLNHLNEIQNLNTRMVMGIPYMGSGALLGSKGLSDVDSRMRGDTTRMLNAKPLVSDYTPGYLQSNPQDGAVLPDAWTRGGRSSRNDMRELYKKVCS
tara:strand:- start:329 stop:817 length:489 start_codon:yes stop_codon:yes gene_type:complete